MRWYAFEKLGDQFDENTTRSTGAIAGIVFCVAKVKNSDWAAQQVRAMLEVWDERRDIIARGMAEHNAEMDERARQLDAHNPGQIEHNHQNPQPAPRPPAPPAQKQPVPPPPKRK